MKSSSPDDSPLRSALIAALAELRQRRAEIEALKRRENEPVAIIGMACRFPGGGDTPEQFWQLLDEGRSAITEVPASRWQVDDYYDPDPAVPGKMATRYGGFLRDVDSFDTHFFGISPRETASLDPQQRLLLEVAWEALENANLPPEQVYASPTGVFVGLTCFDHAIRLASSLNNFDHYAGTGSALNMAAGRVSYFLGLTGPSMVIDTACSSSLVSLHLACQSLRAKESNLALAGGVNLMLSPEVMVSFSQARMLAADGRSKTFDAAADGYVRGEGCGVVVLKRLADALADRDTILGLVRGSAVNQNGPSGGLTVPSAAAQQRVIEQALAQAGVSPDEVDYVEAHGTGTSLGDPIEIETLARVYGEGRTSVQPLLTGSVKTNIGHLEPASGVAGLIKVLLSFRYEKIPAHLNFTHPNPHIDWNTIGVRVTDTATAWPRTGRRRIVGLSAFGFSGTNAQAIIEEPPAAITPPAESGRSSQLLTISAKSEAALYELAASYEAWARRPDLDLAALCRSAGAGRSHFPFRLAIQASSIDELRELLASITAKRTAPQLPVNKSKTAGPKRIGFLFTGQGSQSLGMARQLYETERSFKSNLDQMSALLDPELDVPLLDVVFGRNNDPGLLDQTVYAQPALFAVEYALAELWKSWGVKPFVVMGHSIGEYVAASQAGVMGRDEALQLVAARARLMQQLPSAGAMATIFAGQQAVRDTIKPYGEELAIAAINGPAHTVIAGPIAAVEAAGAEFAELGIRVKQLKVSHAFHSPLMKPMLDEFRSLTREVHFSKPTTRIVSNLTGTLIGEEMTDPEYWVRHVTEPVAFAAGVAALGALSLDTFLEVGPEAVLTVLGRECLADDPGRPSRWLFSLRSQQENWTTMLTTLAALYVGGAAIDWPAFYQDQPAWATELPNYPFQRERHGIVGASLRGRPTDVPRKADQPSAALPTMPTPPAAEAARELLVHRLEESQRLSPEALRMAPEILQALADLDRPGADLSDLLYQVVWEQQVQRQTANGDLNGNFMSGSWLIFADHGGAGEILANLLAKNGQPYVLVYKGSEYNRTADGVWQLDPRAAEDFHRLLREVEATGPVSRIIFLWGLDAPLTDELSFGQLALCQQEGCGAVLNIVHAVAGSRARVWLVTRGAVSAPNVARADGLAQSPLWGFGRGILLEQQERLGGCIDLDPSRPADEIGILMAEIVGVEREDQVAFRDGKRWVPRLTKFAAASTSAKAADTKISPTGTYLITGGLGTLGLHVAQWLVAKGAGQLVLLGRGRSISDEAQVTIAELRSAGATILVEQADVASEADMSDLFARLRTDRMRLRGIVHAAGVPGLGELEELQSADLEAVLRPKVAGSWLLHRLSQDEPLDFLVLFSSVASVWGSRGQAHYSAANRFLDELAGHRRANGLPALCINWGPWGAGGMTSAEANTLLRRIGVRALEPQIAINALDRMLAADVAAVAVADVDWALFRGSYEARGKRPFLARISQGASLETDSAKPSNLVEQLRSSSPAERRQSLQRFIQTEAAAVLGLGAQSPDPEQGFFEMGMDSLLSLEFKARLETAFAMRLAPTLIFDNPTVESLTEFFAAEISGLPVDEQSEIRLARWDESDRSLTRKIEQLSDAEAEELLLQKLEAMH
jgi:acyl transferase domain-containing protein/acyl carrier protein